MKNKTMINDLPSHCANMVLWVSAALHKFKARMAMLWSSGRKRGSAIGADEDHLLYLNVKEDPLSYVNVKLKSIKGKFNLYLWCLGFLIVLMSVTASQITLSFVLKSRQEERMILEREMEMRILEDRLKSMQQRLKKIEQQEQTF
jgi:hypothetical protein